MADEEVDITSKGAFALAIVLALICRLAYLRRRRTTAGAVGATVMSPAPRERR